MQTNYNSYFPGGSSRQSDDQFLREVIDAAALLLPAQGPLTSFVHQNTLHAFENLSFAEAVKAGARVYGCHPYWSEERYRKELERGRIRFEDLQSVLRDDLGAGGTLQILAATTRFDLRLSMLQYLFSVDPLDEIRWTMSETAALRTVRSECNGSVRTRLIAETQRWITGASGGIRKGLPSEITALLRQSGQAYSRDFGAAAWEALMLQSLWHVCLDGMRCVPAFVPPPVAAIRHRDLILQATGADIDAWVNEVMIRFCGAFLDQGLAPTSFPGRDRGMFAAFCSLYRQEGGPQEPWMDGLGRELGRLDDTTTKPLESIRQSLALLGLAEAEWKPFLSATLLCLRGWGGMVRQIELHGECLAHPLTQGSLTDLLAIRLLLERFALAHACRTQLKYDGPLCGLREEVRRQSNGQDKPSAEKRAFEIFQLAQVNGWSPETLHALTPREWARLIEEIEGFPSVERRRVFHLAYERQLTQRALDAVLLLERRAWSSEARPRLQAVFCIDEREESIRRHLEELEPNAETFGAPAYFHVPMYYRGMAEAGFLRLSPGFIQPAHWIVEEAQEEKGSGEVVAQPRRAAFLARLWRRACHALGSLAASLPIAIPGWGTGPIRRACHPARTRLLLERKLDPPGPTPGHIGFSVAEMTQAADRLLQEMGMTLRFAPWVLLVGHGSQSLNNPHDAAYNCGACGGASSGPNSRAAARFLNDPRVRQGLTRRGVVIPDDTIFVGAYHDTCTDAMTFFDIHRMEEPRRTEFEEIRSLIEKACDRNAHERCRKFTDTPALTLSYAEARRQVRRRAEDLAQMRPELGHAGNALCVIGRREMTRGLFLDRRAFLASYDPMQDDEDTTQLARTLRAVLPICAGINLEYFFSSVDAAGWGAGTKLPHNITALVGVMDGAASDLRTGLPSQLVDMHEPVRLLVIVEATVPSITRILDHEISLGRLCRNGWVRLAVRDPVSGVLSVLKEGGFTPYVRDANTLAEASSSLDWYRGWSDYQEFAEIMPRP